MPWAHSLPTTPLTRLVIAEIAVLSLRAVELEERLCLVTSQNALRTVQTQAVFRCRSFNAITLSSNSCRQLPTQRSGTPFWQGLPIVCHDRPACLSQRN